VSSTPEAQQGASESALTKRQRELPWLLALATSALWIVAHLAMHLPRGWPFTDRRGEWDFLMTAVAMAAGEPPDVVLGAVFGSELGSYLIAALVAVPVAFGADPPAVTRVLGLLAGLIFVGTATWLSGWFAVRIAGSRAAAASVGAASGVMALAWQGLHMEFEGLSGNSVESFLLGFVALSVVVTTPAQGAWRRALLVGCLMGVAGLFSPVAVWSAAGIGIAGLVLTDGWRRRAKVLLLGVLGGLIPFFAFALLLPAGDTALESLLELRFGSGVGGLPFSSSAPGLRVIGLVGGALAGSAVNGDLVVRDAALYGLGWLLASALIVVAITGLGRRDLTRRVRVLAAVGASWAVPVMLQSNEHPYPLAYRYWMVGVGVSFVLLPLALLRTGRLGAGVGVASVITALIVAFSLPRAIFDPPLTRAAAIGEAAAHSMAPREGRGRHEQYLRIAPHLAWSDERAGFAEGYGMHLGADHAMSSPPDTSEWRSLAEALPENLRPGYLVGVGCGLTVRPLAPRTLTQIRRGPANHQAPLWWGLGRCSEAPAMAELEGEPAFEAGRSNRPMGPIRSVFVDPAQSIAPRGE